MAVYESVTWEPGDEVTSAKLNKMAQNAEWLKDNAINADYNFIIDSFGRPPKDRSAASSKMTKIVAVEVNVNALFNSVSQIAVTFQTPTGFTTPPTTFVSLYSNLHGVVAVNAVRPTTSSTVINLYCSDPVNKKKRLDGRIHVLFVGK